MYIGKHLAGAVSIQNGLKQRDDLPPLFFKVVSEHAIMTVQEKKEGVDENETRRLLACVSGVTLLDENINIIKKKTQATLSSLYVSMYCHQTAEQNQNSKMWQSSNIGG